MVLADLLLAKMVLPGSWLSRRPVRLLELSAEVPQFTFPWIGDMDAAWKLLKRDTFIPVELFRVSLWLL